LLGSNLAWYFREKADVVGLFNVHAVTIPGVEVLGFDLQDHSRTHQVMARLEPDVLVHCAARTDIDGQEKDREGAQRSNVLTTDALLESLREASTKVVFISTDSVYSGSRGPYGEEDATDPRNWYGHTKLEAERLVAARPGSLILRTNIFGWNIQDKLSLGEWFLANLRAGNTVTGFTDAICSTLYTFSFAEILDLCLSRNISGLYNLATRDAWSKYRFGQELARIFRLDPGCVHAGSLDDVPFTAQRGKDLSLDVGKLEQALGGHSMPTSMESLQAFHRDDQAGLPLKIKQQGKGGGVS